MSNPATTRQKGKIHGTLAKLGVTERDDKLAALSALVYRRVDSTNSLSFDEAHACIDVLVSVTDRDDPTGYLAQLVADGTRWLERAG